MILVHLLPHLKPKIYTITLGGTTDFNEPPSITMGGVTSGAYGTQKDSTATKTVSLNSQTALSSLISTVDPDTASTVNSAEILLHWIKRYYACDADIVALSQDLVLVLH